MSAECSTAPVIWNWVIQSLANFKQVDSSTLVGLVKKAPAISDDLGKDAREMVSLRILESLFVYGNEATVDNGSAQNAKICFDPSEHCEDILRKILDETSDSMTETERQKWDIRPFIMHKRSSLPKPPLQKLKEALLEGSHPLLASLKERSKLGVTNTSGNISPGVDVNFDSQTTVAKNYLASLNPPNEKNKFQENLLQKSDQAEHIGRKECETSIDPPAKNIDENTFMDQAASKNLEQSCDNANGNHDNVPQDTYIEGQNKRLSINNTENLEFVSKSVPSCEANDSIEHVGQLETGTDDEKSDDVWTDDIASKKEAFLSQDSMAMADWTEISLCMKCNEGGQLLICSSDACPLRIHESCLGSSATLDENGNFFCPFCAYSRAISKYMELKKKASLARNNLQAFLRFGIKRGAKISSKNESRKSGALGETIEETGNGDAVNRGKNVNCVSNKDDCALAESSSKEVSGCGPKSLSREGDGRDYRIGENADIHLNAPEKPKHQKRTPKRKCNKKESHVPFVSDHSRRPHKRKPQYTSPSIPSLRRKALPWTKAEEDILKEGVRRFWSNDRKGIPWKEILDFGRDVFEKGRTGIDLKDKWRNICKGSPVPKKRKL